MESQFDNSVIDDMPQRPVAHDLDLPPSADELTKAIKSLRESKASGESGVLPEMVTDGSSELHNRLLSLMVMVWSEGGVVKDWRNAIVVPIPKKGDLHSCDNWRGISLLDVVGKLFARIMQYQLQSLADDLLPDSQRGFRW